MALALFPAEAAASEWLKPGQHLQSFTGKAELVGYLRGLTCEFKFLSVTTILNPNNKDIAICYQHNWRSDGFRHGEVRRPIQLWATARRSIRFRWQRLIRAIPRKAMDAG